MQEDYVVMARHPETVTQLIISVAGGALPVLVAA
jgi:hypothetical protein